MLCDHHASPAPRLEGHPSRVEWAEPQASGTVSRLELVGFCDCNLPSPESLLNPAEQDLPWTFWGAYEEVPALIARSKGALRPDWCHGRHWLHPLAG